VLAFVLLFSTLLLAAGVAALVAEPGFARKLVAERGLGEEARWLWWMLASVGAAGLLAAAWGRVRGALVACALVLGLLWSGYGLVVHPLLDDENSARGLMQKARERAGDGVAIGLVDWKEQQLLQAVGPVVEFGFRQPVPVQAARAKAWLLEAPDERWLLVQRSEALACADFGAAGAAERLGTANRREWWLLRAAALTACP
jgi:hypothetical protein